jgi:hypothetical protein
MDRQSAVKGQGALYLFRNKLRAGLEAERMACQALEGEITARTELTR